MRYNPKIEGCGSGHCSDFNRHVTNATSYIDSLAVLLIGASIILFGTGPHRVLVTMKGALLLEDGI